MVEWQSGLGFFVGALVVLLGWWKEASDMSCSVLRLGERNSFSLQTVLKQRGFFKEASRMGHELNELTLAKILSCWFYYLTIPNFRMFIDLN